MLQLEEARARILAALKTLPGEAVPLLQSAGRVLQADCKAPIDLPPFDNSAMDGYAVRCDDLKPASEKSPVSLEVSANIPAGGFATAPLLSGTCARIFTGSALPPHADAVVMQEDVQRDGARAFFREAARPWENIRLRGEDVKAGAIVVRAGERMGFGGIALLGALGVGAINVSRKPIVGLLATGSELQDAGAGALGPGQIYESNRAALSALLCHACAEPRIFPIVADSLEATKKALTAALENSDVLVTSGGVSVGEHDLVKDAFESLGGKLDFWRIAIRPGKPFAFGILGGKYLFGLPGNPVSASVTALLLVFPALLHMQGAREVELPSHIAIAAEDFANKGDRRHFVRVRVDNAGKVYSTGLQASHALVSLASANGLIDVPPNSVVARGTEIRVLRFP